ncbi:unnamed protein product, partial [Gulo gulo]
MDRIMDSGAPGHSTRTAHLSPPSSSDHHTTREAPHNDPPLVCGASQDALGQPHRGPSVGNSGVCSRHIPGEGATSSWKLRGCATTTHTPSLLDVGTDRQAPGHAAASRVPGQKALTEQPGGAAFRRGPPARIAPGSSERGFKTFLK